MIDPGRFNGVADVLIDEGRVVAVGPHLKVPAGATKIDATLPPGPLKLTPRDDWFFPALSISMFISVSRVSNIRSRSGAERQRRWSAVSPQSVVCLTRIQ